MEIFLSGEGKKKKQNKTGKAKSEENRLKRIPQVKGEENSWDVGEIWVQNTDQERQELRKGIHTHWWFWGHFSGVSIKSKKKF